jgi:predicted dehydrogenase
MNQFHPSRRTALKAAAILPLTLPFTFAKSLRAADDKDKPKIALIGCGGMGKYDAKNASRFGKIVAVCDVDADRAAAATAQNEQPGATIYTDFRKLLDQEKDLSAIINATPDHWHTIINLAAIKAGKDVYSEKPLTLTIDEGKRLVKAAKDYKRVVQTGSQQRSDKLFRQACLLVRAGRLGKLSQVTSVLPAGLHGGPFKTSDVPKGLDWEMWQGQAPKTDYIKERCHSTFRFWSEYSGGSITDWGAHHNDIVRWALNVVAPKTVVGKRLIEPVSGGYTTASEYEVTYTYEGGVTHVCKSTTESTIFGEKKPDKQVPRSQMLHGIRFEGADGWLWVTRGKIEASKPEILNDKLSADEHQVQVCDDHMANFFECMKTRKDPICSAEVGHRSVSICHIGNIAMKVGRKLSWDAEKEEFVNDKEANNYLAREQRKPWTYDMA